MAVRTGRAYGVPEPGSAQPNQVRAFHSAGALILRTCRRPPASRFSMPAVRAPSSRRTSWARSCATSPPRSPPREHVACCSCRPTRRACIPARGRSSRSSTGCSTGEVERVDVMPALGTHQPLGPAECRLMFGDAIDPARLLHHRWRDDVTTIGELSADEVDDGRRASARAHPAVRRQPRARRRLLRPRRLGRAGRAARGGRVRRLHEARLDRARRRARRSSAAISSAPSTGSSRRWDASMRRSGSCSTAASTASSSRAAGCCSRSPSSRRATTGRCCAASSPARAARARPEATAFRAAAALSAEVNIETVATPFRRCVAYLDPDEYRSTWLGNKAIYRTRLAMADGGELVVARAGRVALRRGPRRRRADPAARLPRARSGARGDGGRPRARGEPRGGRASDPRLDRGALHRHLRARPGALARRHRGRRLPVPALDEAREQLPRSTASRYICRTRGSGCGGSEGRPLHRGAPRLGARAVPQRRRPADRQPARAHRRAAPRRSRRAARPAGPALRHRPTTTSCGCSTRRACRSSAAGLGGEADVDDRAVWQLLADNVHLFALTPTGLWLRETLATVFGIEERLDSASAETIYARVEEQLATPAFAPRALLDRFRVECLSTTDAAGSSLAEHRALADSRAGLRIRPTFRPDAVVALDAPGWRDALVRARGRRRPRGRRLRDVRRRARRAPRCVQGARRDRDRSRGDERRHDASRRARGVRVVRERRSRASVSHGDARRFEAHMLNEFARMSCDDGLVMQLHVGSLRDHNGPLAERFGRDIGADIPVATDWTRGLRPLLEACGNDPGFARHSLHARREHVQPRAGAARGPLSRGLARLPVVVPRQPGGHRPLPRPGDRDGRALQPRRLRRRRARADGASCAARPLAPPHVRLARPQGRRRLPRRGRGAPPRVRSSPTASCAARTGSTRRRRTRRSRRRPGRRRR